MSSFVFDVNTKPQNEGEFAKWMEAKFEVNGKLVKSNYDSNALSLLDQFKKSPFWLSVGERVKEWDTLFYSQTGVHLFVSTDVPSVVTKSYDSLLNKAYRKNCLKNKEFPSAPKDGWIGPDTWYDRIHDIVRTSFVVKYLDGVKFLEQKLKAVADEITCDFMCSYETHEDGYYAAHIAVRQPMYTIGMDWQKTEHIIEVEIQITTELQEMIKRLLHKYYEDNRRKEIPEDYKWQWDYHSEQFVPNYLGHIAHYLEGIIVEIRDKQK